MKLSEIVFKPKYEEIPIYEDFKILFERITKPELNSMIRKSIKMKGDNIEFLTKKMKIRIGNKEVPVEISLIAIELAKKVKGWEGLTGKILKEIIPSLEIEIEDDIEIEYSPEDVIRLFALAEVPQEDGSYKPLDTLVFEHVNRFVIKEEEELLNLEGK